MERKKSVAGISNGKDPVFERHLNEWCPSRHHPQGSHRRVPGDGADGQKEGRRGDTDTTKRLLFQGVTQKGKKHSIPP